ncbi:MAG: histidine triad nucleotide-binding protein [Thiotrichaceae bacterium]|uniref:Histidine triad nucleotide-binding protein n=1 Tax=Candidatus Thiocaldithrix dubininis TaxID=3080823 RepID=A0AA95H607_9GAMM|nr:MAG: histidine triad nucleotide-binding protein [Candidatus Thiocaldithrix dubininis]
MSQCLFCRIAAGEIPANILYSDEDVLAFRDINPQAPLHALVIPRKHIATINDLQADDAALVGKLFLAAKQVAKEAGYAEDGYRVVMNCGLDAGQTVFHIHLHILAGRALSWPPG